MLSGPRDLLRLHVVGAFAVLLLGVAHGIHDLFEGDPAVAAFLPALSIALHVATLSAGHLVARRRAWPRWLAFGFAVAVSVAFGCLTATLHPWRENLTTFDVVYATTFSGFGVLAFWFLVFYFPGQLLEVRTRLLTAENDTRKAELDRLRANLHPHFLLNTLNAVAGLVGSEPRQARQLIGTLGDLLRDSLQDDGEMKSLGHEVDWLQRYARIFEIRHSDAIEFEWSLSPETRRVPIPHLLLQPLLENAIEHGALRRQSGGKVTLSSRVTGASIRVAIIDNGPGMPAERREGLGLRLVRDRLLFAYPTAKMVVDSSDAGTCIAVELPHPGDSR
jgi:signal transduction histidine kinase